MPTLPALQPTTRKPPPLALEQQQPPDVAQHCFVTLLNVSDGTYLTVESSGSVRLSRKAVGECEKLSQLDSPDGTVSFKSAFGTFLAVEGDGCLRAKGRTLDASMKFRRVLNEDGTTVLRCFNNSVVGASDDGSVSTFGESPDMQGKIRFEIRPAAPMLQFDGLVANISMQLGVLGGMVDLLKARHEIEFDHARAKLRFSVNDAETTPTLEFDLAKASKASEPLGVPSGDNGYPESELRVSKASDEDLTAVDDESEAWSDGGLVLELNSAWEGKVDTVTDSRNRRDSYSYDVFARASFGLDMKLEAPPKQGLRNCVQYLVMKPSSTFCLSWSLAGMVFLVYDAVYIPVSVFDPPETWWTAFITYLSLAFWMLDMAVSCLRGYVNADGKFEMQFEKVVLRYFRTHFLGDLLLVSIEWVAFLASTVFSEHREYTTSARLYRTLRFSRLIKVGKMPGLFDRFVERVRSPVLFSTIGMYKVLLLVYFGNHVVACGWYAISVYIPTDGNHWWSEFADSNSIDDLTDMKFAERYVACLQWSSSMLGFGDIDIYPQNKTERIYAISVTCYCMVAIAWLVGSFVVGMERLQTLRKEQWEKENQLRNFMCTHSISWPLRNRIWSLLQKSKKKKKQHVLENSVELIRGLPRDVIVQLRAEVFVPILTAHPFFNTYAVSQANKRAMHMIVENETVQEIQLESEHELFAHGHPAASMYFVVRGTISYNLRRAEIHKWDEVESWDSFEGGRSTEVRQGKWLSEPALWLNWHHKGTAVGKSYSELVLVVAEKFQSTMHAELPEAQGYAHKFLLYAQRNKSKFNDVYTDVSCLWAMAQDIFEPPRVFDVTLCQPQYSEAVGRNEWQPSGSRAWQRLWTSPFAEIHHHNRSALLSTMTTDMKHDTILVYQTMFSQNSAFSPRIPQMTEPERTAHDLRVLFLKRLYLCFAMCRVMYATEDNGAVVRPWPFPLASVLCHGSRVLVRLNGVPWKKFVNFLLFGDTESWDWDQKVPEPLFQRMAGTHSVMLDPNTWRLMEKKVGGTGAIGRHHLGMDLPIGGLGNPLPEHKSGRLYVGPAGVPYHHARMNRGPIKYAKDIQHGHMYMRWCDFGEKMVLKPRSSEKDAGTPAAAAARRKSGAVLDAPPTGRRSSEWSNIQSPTPSSEQARSGKSETPASKSSPTGLRGSLRRVGSAIGGMTEFGQRKCAESSESSRRSSVGPFYRHNSDLAAYLVEEEESWAPLASTISKDGLAKIMVFCGHEEAADDSDGSLSELYKYITENGELTLETNDEGCLRCRGFIVQLVIELEDGGEEKVLVNTSITGIHGDQASSCEMSPRSTSRDDGSIEFPCSLHQRMSSDSSVNITSANGMIDTSLGSRPSAPSSARRVEEPRVVTILRRHHEAWESAVTHCLTSEFKLHSGAVKNIIDGCRQCESTIYSCGAAQTLGHRHKACCKTIPLNYEVLKLQTQIPDSERHLFGPMLSQMPFRTVGKREDVYRYENCPRDLGNVEYHWMWMTKEDARARGVIGIVPPKDRVSTQLVWEPVHAGALLVGIECSAPLKTDIFGTTHSVDGKPKKVSAFGKRKWKDYRGSGRKVPGDIGAIRTCINEAQFELLQELCKSAITCKPSDGGGISQEREKRFFRKLLQAPDEDLDAILLEHHNLTRCLPEVKKRLSMMSLKSAR